MQPTDDSLETTDNNSVQTLSSEEGAPMPAPELQITPAPDSLEEPAAPTSSPGIFHQTDALDPVAAEETAAVKKKKRPGIFRLHRVALLVTVALLLIIIAGSFGAFSMYHDQRNQPNREDAAYAVTTLKVEGLQNNIGLDIGQANHVAINGELRVNNGLILNPGSQPGAPTLGQLYVDSASRQLYYFNGTAFVTFASAEELAALRNQQLVQQGTLQALMSRQEITGIGNGLELNGTILSNAGVTSINGTPGQIITSGTAGDITLSLPEFAFGDILYGGGAGGPIGNIATMAAGRCLMSNGVGQAPSFQNCPGIEGNGNVFLGPSNTTGRIAMFSVVDNQITDSLIVQSGGTITIDGDLQVANVNASGVFTGNGSGLTDLNGSNITTGTVADARLSTNVALLDASQIFGGTNTFTNTINAFGGINTGGVEISSGVINGQTISNNADFTGTMTIAGVLTVNTLGTNGGSLLCLNASNQIAQCSGGIANFSLQQAYDYSTNPEIVLNSTNGALTIRDAVAPLGANLLEVQNNTGSTTYLAVHAGGISVTGDAGISGTLTVGGLSEGVLRANSSGVISTGTVALGVETTGDYVLNLGSLTGLSTAGNSGAGSTPSLAVLYGAAANTAVQGNTQLVCPVGTGNLSGGGNTITLGAGGSCNDLTVVDSPTFSGTLSVEGVGGITIGVPNTTSGVLYLANSASSNLGSLNIAALGQATTYTLPDPGAGTAEICLNTGNCTTGGPAGGDLTGTYPNPTIAKLQGVDLALSSVASGQILQYNGTAFVNQFVSGDIALDSSAVATIQNGVVTNAKLANSSLTVTAGAGLGGGGSVALGGSVSLSVAYGSAANTAVQGNTTLICPSGTGNLSGGGNTITLGVGGSCDNLTVVSSPTFSGNLSVLGSGGITIGVPGTTAGILNLANPDNTNIGTLNTAALGQATTFTLPDPGTGTAEICLDSGNCTMGGPAGGDLTGTYPNPTIAKLQGIDLAISSVTGGQVLLYNGSEFVNQSISGDITLNNSGVATIQNGVVTNAKLQNSSLTVTAGNGLGGGGSVALGASTSLSVLYGSTANTAVQGNTQLVCATGTGNLTGGGNTITLGSGGSCNDLTVVNSPTFSGALSVQGSGGITIGVAGTTAGVLHLASSGNSNLGSLNIATLGQATTYTLPDPGAGTATICLDNGNCAGAGGGIVGSGTAGRLARFNGTGSITDSTLSESGTTVTASGNFVIQGAGSLTLGTSSTHDGSIAFLNNSGGNSVTLAAPASNPASSFTLRLPNAAGSNGNCLLTDGSGNLYFGACTGGVGGGVTSLNGEIGVVTLGNASASSGTITIDDASTSQKGIAQFNSTNFSVSSGVVNTIQDIATGSAPTFSALTLQNNTTALSLSGAPAASATSSLVQIGSAIVGGDASANGGTYIGLNAPGSGAGSVADFLNFQVNGSSRLRVTSAGAITAAGQLTVSSGGLAVTGNSSITGNLTGLTALSSSGTITFSSLGAGLVQSSSGGVLSSGAVNRNSATFFNTALTVANGGTGATSFTANGILYGNGTGALQATGAAANSVLVTNGSNVPSLSQALPTAVQGNITTTGALASGSITTGFGTISTGNNITTTAALQGAVINATTGFRINGAAVSGTYLRGDGTNYVASTIQAGDLPGGSDNYIQNSTTLQTDADFNIDGSGTMGTLAVTGASTLGGQLTVTTGGASITGNSSITGTLSVSAATTLSSTLAVTGATTLSSTLAVTGAITGSSTIQGTTINGTTGINTGAAGGTQRIDSSGNLLNIGTITFAGGGGDTNLYRQVANHLRTDDNFSVNSAGDDAGEGEGVYLNTGGVVNIIRPNANDVAALRVSVTGDTKARFSAQGSGSLWWGDGTNTVDTNLYRSAANLLQSDDDFRATGFGVGADPGSNMLLLQNTASRYTQVDSNGQLTIRYDDNSQTTGGLFLQNLDTSSSAGSQLRVTLADSSGNAITASDIRTVKEQNWTSTASTQDAAMVFRTALNGVLTEAGRFTSGGNFQLQGSLTTASGDLSLNPAGSNVNFNSKNLTSVGTITSGLINGQTISSSANFTGTLAVATLGTSGNTAVCLNGSNQLATCGTNVNAVTLQQAYNASTGGSTPEIVLDNTRGGLTIADASTPIGMPLLEVKNNAGNISYLSTTATGTTLTGTLTVSSTIATSLGSNGSTVVCYNGSNQLSTCSPTGGTGNFILNGTSPQTANFNITGTGVVGSNLAVGTSISGAAQLLVGGTMGNAAATQYGQLISTTYAPTTNMNENFYGLHVTPQISDASATGAFTAQQFGLRSTLRVANSTQTVSTAVALQAGITKTGAGTLSVARDLSIGGNYAAGTVTTHVGLHVATPAGAASITNHYGIFLESQAGIGSGNNYAIFSSGGDVRFNDGNFLQSGTGTFGTGSGAVSLNGATSVTGSNTFTVGTGATSLGGTLAVTDRSIFNGSGNGSNTYGALFKNGSDSTTAFQVQNAAGVSILNVDTSGGRVGIGAGATSGDTLDVDGDIFVRGNLRLDDSTRQYTSDYSTTIASGIPIKIGEYTFAGNSRNVLITGEVRGQTGQASGVSRFIVSVRANTLPNKAFSFSQDTTDNGRPLRVKVYQDEASGKFVLAYIVTGSIQNAGWTITAMERGNYDGFQNNTTYEELDTTGLTEVGMSSNYTQSWFGNAVFQNVADSATAFRIQNAAGTDVVTVNTSTPGLTASGTLDVTGAASLSNTLAVSGNTNIGGGTAVARLTVTGGGGNLGPVWSSLGVSSPSSAMQGGAVIQSVAATGTNNAIGLQIDSTSATGLNYSSVGLAISRVTTNGFGAGLLVDTVTSSGASGEHVMGAYINNITTGSAGNAYGLRIANVTNSSANTGNIVSGITIENSITNPANTSNVYAIRSLSTAQSTFAGAISGTGLSLSQNNATALQLTGAAAGLTIGGDANLYRTASNTLKTDSALVVADKLTIGAASSAGEPLHITSSSQFDPNNARTSAFVTLEQTGGTQGINQYGAGINFGKINGNRPGGAIASVQTTADPDQLGLAFFTHGSSTTNDVLVEMMRLDHNGNLGIGITPTASAGLLQLASGTTAASGIAFGTDTNLYRSAADTLQTNDSFVLNGTGANLTVGGTLSVTGKSTQTGVIQEVSSPFKAYRNLASYHVNSATSAGAIVIETNVPIASNTMTRTVIEGYFYDSTGPFRIEVGGYMRSAGNFPSRGYVNVGAKKVSVRFGTNAAGNGVIILGETSDTFAHPKLAVTYFLAGHGTLNDNFGDGWTISQKTDLAAYSNLTTVPETTLITDGSLSSNVALLNRNSQTFTGNNQLFKNVSDSTTAFQIQNAAGTTFFNADSTNRRITISNGDDLTLGGGGLLLIGNASASNIVFDTNEIQARNNGAASELVLNASGGTVYLGSANTGLTVVRNALNVNTNWSTTGQVAATITTASNISGGGTATGLFVDAYKSGSGFSSTIVTGLDVRVRGTNDTVGLFRTDGGTVMAIQGTGQVEIPTQGSSGGLLIGGDASLYRGAAGLLQTNGRFLAEHTATSNSQAALAGKTNITTAVPVGFTFGTTGNVSINLSSGTQGVSYGLYGSTDWSGSGGSVSNLASVAARPTFSGVSPGGTITNLYGFWARRVNNNASGTPTLAVQNAYGMYIENQAANWNTNTYGVYIEGQTTGVGLQFAAATSVAAGIQWGSDVQLYRSGANTLSVGTTTALTASGSLAVRAAGTGTLTLDTAGAGTVTIGTNATTLSLGASGTTAVTVGSTTGTSTTTIQAGSGNINLTSFSLFSSGARVSGGLHVNTSTNTTPLTVGRGNGTVEELMAIGVEDAATRFTYTNDEAGGSIVFRIINTDTEGSDGSNANDNTILQLRGDSSTSYAQVGTSSTGYLRLQNDSGTSLSGITFGSGADTKLYRSAKGNLHTNGSMIVQGSSTGPAFMAATTTYSAGTIAQAGTAITGTGTTFTAAMVGGTIVYSDGTTRTIAAFNSATSLTASTTKTVAAGSSYTIYYGGFSVMNSGKVISRAVANSTGYFQLQNAAGAVLFNVDSTNGRITIDGGSDVSLGGGGYLIVGDTSAANTVYDTNEIQARNNGSAAHLYLNYHGGHVSISEASYTTTVRGALSVVSSATIGTGLTVTAGGATVTAGDLVVTGGNVTTGGTQRLSNGGALSNITGYSQSSGNFSQSGSGTFGTGTGAVSLNGNTSVTGSNTLTVGTGATTLGGTLTVAGATTLSSTLQVVGNTNLQGSTEVASTLNTPFGGFGRFSNLANNSEDFTSWWAKNNVTVTADSTTAPNGTQTADTLTGTSGTAIVTGANGTLSVGSATYTLSVWMKTASGTQTVQLRIDGQSSGNGTAKTVTVTDQWQRFSVTQDTTGFSGNLRPRMYIGGIGGGNGASVYAWGAQIEESTSTGPYTPVTSANYSTILSGLSIAGQGLFRSATNSTAAFQVQRADTTTLFGVDTTNSRIFSGVADGASAIAFKFDTNVTYSTAGAKLLSVQNNGSERFSIDKNGHVKITTAGTTTTGAANGTPTLCSLASGSNDARGIIHITSNGSNMVPQCYIDFANDYSSTPYILTTSYSGNFSLLAQANTSYGYIYAPFTTNPGVEYVVTYWIVE